MAGAERESGAANVGSGKAGDSGGWEGAINACDETGGAAAGHRPEVEELLVHRWDPLAGELTCWGEEAMPAEMAKGMFGVSAEWRT